MSFKVGDKVRRYKNSTSGGLSAGETGIVSGIYGPDWVNIEGKGEWIHHASTLELIKETKMIDFKKVKTGDRIKFTQASDHVLPEFVGKIGTVTTVTTDWFDFTVDGGGSSTIFASNSYNDKEAVKFAEATMDDLQEGIIIENSGYNYDREVQVVIGKIVFTIDSDDEAVRSTSLQKLKENGWTVKSDEPEITEVTLEEVADKLGVDVATLRIKD